MPDPKLRRPTGGRPTAAAAIRLEAAILEEATAAFLRDGYAATSMESIAKACGVAKRTIYVRWNGKAALFRAVVENLMGRWLTSTGHWPSEGDLKTVLTYVADQIMGVALSPDAIALHRLLIAESGRFAELPRMLSHAGAGAGIARVAALLEAAADRGEMPHQDTILAAEQFMHLLLAGPQRRALGLGVSLAPEETKAWRDEAIRLFLRGVMS